MGSRFKYVKGREHGPEKDLYVKVSSFKLKNYNLIIIFYIILEIVCDKMTPFENGKRYLLSRDSSKLLLKKKAILHVGNTVEFECEEGFTLDGPAEVQCLEDGSLSEEEPICQPIPCTLAPM